ncbi:MAG TPA: hypothetical protein VIK71_09320 [Flavobacteriales bacterium]
MTLRNTHIRFALSLLFLSYCLGGYSQQRELEAFKQSIIQYNEYAAGKAEEAGHKTQSAEQYRSNIDKTFRDFILLKNSENYEQFNSFEEGKKEFYLDEVALIHVKLFELGANPYGVYSFNSFVATDYYIKDLSSNKIVFHNNQRTQYVDSVYKIDKHHILIIEKYDEMNTGRRAFVVKADKKGWQKINAFEGNELIYMDEKRFKKERPYLLVNCSFETNMLAPRNASQISYNEHTQTISYRTFEDSRDPQTVAAKWNGGHFIIDDYDVGIDIQGFSPVGAP